MESPSKYQTVDEAICTTAGVATGPTLVAAAALVTEGSLSAAGLTGGLAAIGGTMLGGIAVAGIASFVVYKGTARFLKWARNKTSAAQRSS